MDKAVSAFEPDMFISRVNSLPGGHATFSRMAGHIELTNLSCLLTHRSYTIDTLDTVDNQGPALR